MATPDIYGEFDWLSNLPESLLCSIILPRLPLTDAVRSSLLSRKWRYLWTKIPHLHFFPDFFTHMMVSPRRFSRIKETMEQILIQHDASLESLWFHLSVPMDIHQCIQYAARKGMKRMVLQDDTSSRSKMHLPFSFYSCTTIVDLELESFIIPEIPILSEKTRRVVSASSGIAAHKLSGVNRFEIQAPSLNYLIVVGCTCVESLTADCPQLLQLRIRDRSSLAKLQINSYNLVELKLRDCYKLSKLQLNSCVFLKEAGSLEGHFNVESLRKLSLTRCSSALSHLPFLTLFGTFPDLEELQVSLCMMGIAPVAAREQVACEMEMVPHFIFPNLKNAYLDVLSDLSEKDVAVLGFLLKNAPSLKTLTLTLPYSPEGIDHKEFKIQVGGLKRASAEVEIIWKNDYDDDDVDECYPQYDDYQEYEDEDVDEYYQEYEDDPDRGWEYESQNEDENDNDSTDEEWWEDYNCRCD